MERILKPKENFNPQKLCGELKKEGIDNRIWDKEDGYLLEWDIGEESLVEEVISLHDPVPEPDRPSQEELNAQAIEEIIAMLMEGDKYEI
ncbi:hypothetical protein [Eubacterium maltosivorans]|uniref:hypothetical protein n=1 Tax=Eubacterium maltosivorans TaxID=2041044 RepID=UPI00189F0C62|nr:hypothetical protein [Eubacterium maltosivorans]